MADLAVYHRRPARPLIDELLDSPQRFELIQALAILERVARPMLPLGQGIDPELESVRIEQDPSLKFASGDVTSITRPPELPEGVEEGGTGLARIDHDRRPVLRTPVIGVSGVNGPLPYAFTEMMIERVARRDKSMAAFLDLFNHRVVSILYRIRRSTLPLLDGHPENSVLATALRSFIGIGIDSLRQRLPDVPDRILLGFAGILANQRRSAAGLRTILAGAFDADVEIESFTGRWLPLDDDSRTVLSPTRPEDARRLGHGAILGKRVWDQSARFVVHFRFKSLERYEEFLPIGRHHRAVMALCRFYGGELTDVVLKLSLAADAVPPPTVSASRGRRLGWTTWLGKRTAEASIRLVTPGGERS